MTFMNFMNSVDENCDNKPLIETTRSDISAGSWRLSLC